MSFLMWIIFGALVGWVASLIMNTDADQGAVANIIIGILGAFIGGTLSTFLGGPSVSEFSISSIIVAVLGAVVLLFFLKMLGGRRGTL